RNRAGKACLKVGEGNEVLLPAPFGAAEFPGDASVAAVNSEGRLLLFPAAELPELARGKGNKLFGISSRKYADGTERLVAAAVLGEGDSLLLRSGQRT